MAMRKLLMAVCILSVALGAERALAQASTHHMVGGDGGWFPKSDLSSWSSSRVFRVGDMIWFNYPAAEENLVELKSKDEYEACDLSNPIRMFTGGLDVIPLEEEGIRYFASGISESCKNGLKVHVDIQSQTKPENLVAEGPTSGALAQLNRLSFGLLAGLFLSYYLL